jgi:hypothetical protein
MWKKIDKYHIKNGEWTIAKMHTKDSTKYALWNGKDNHGYFNSADEAKAKYEELNK